MSILQAIILGIIQGLTEFLPVSSSGHLILAQKFLGFSDLDKLVCFDLVCHLGTLLAILLIFSKEILNKDRTLIKQVLVGTLPLFPLALFANHIKLLFDKTEYLGLFFLCTALLLWLGIQFGWNKSPQRLQKERWKDAFIIGLFQAFAILPGVSRSGSTISGARLLGWSPREAVTFSFLLSIPAILGGATLECVKALTNAETQTIGFLPYFVGFLTSFIIGLGALLLLIRLAERNQFHYFVWYLIILGIGSLFYFNV